MCTNRGIPVKWTKMKGGEELMYSNCIFRKGDDGEKEEEERLLKQLVTIANSNNGKKLNFVRSSFWWMRLYLDASVNDKVDTMTLHQAYDIVAGHPGLVKLDKVQKTAIKERIRDLVNTIVIVIVSLSCPGPNASSGRTSSSSSHPI